jgi:wobble nucleotide-excising tRNase
MARMNDELHEPANSAKLIICIDDPISSLDSNHVFFMYSLIESVIMKPQVYQQIFILTHHLDFLKYVKKLTIPKYLPDPGAKSPKDDVAHFLVERKSETNSVLRYAPKYLKDYITEFNYLFACIYKCALSDVSDETIENEYHYSFGNNLRKFLEALMYFKYPDHGMTNDQRLRKFWGTDDVSFSLVNRVVNEYSHLESQFDRSLQPIDVDAIRKVAEAVMNRMKAIDADQYAALVGSIGKGEI